MQHKTIQAAPHEVRVVSENWTAYAEERGATITSSTWEVTGGLTLGTASLNGSVATAKVTVSGCGTVKNNVVLSNGETLSAWRHVEAWS